MRIKGTTPRSGIPLRPRLLAVIIGLVAATAAAMPSATAALPQDYGTTQLSQVSDAVLKADVEGTAWYVDQTSDRVVVTADSTVSRAEIAKIKKMAGDNAGAIEVERTGGVFTRLLSAGEAVYGGGYRCSLGFNVVSGGTYYFLTAGHCGNVAGTWYTDPEQTALVGSTVDSSFPGNDYALVRYADTYRSPPGGFSSAADAYVGEPAERTGSGSGTHSGTVTALDVTVHYSDGSTVSGMIQTDICAEPGDSGGPLYDGTTALGITSGGGGDCSTGGTTFYQPVPEALSEYGVSVY